MKRTFLGLGLAVVVVTCGGKAVIDPPSGGNGGSGAASTPTSSNIQSSSVDTTVSTSTGILGSICEAACDSLEECASLSDCEEACENKTCRQEHQAWLGCSLGEVGTLCGDGPVTVCGDELDAYLACSDLIESGGCSVGPGACFCSASAGDFGHIEQNCDGNGECACFRGDELVGKCVSDAGCSANLGCCAGVFFAGTRL